MEDYDGSSWSTVTVNAWQSDWNINCETDHACYEDPESEGNYDLFLTTMAILVGGKKPYESGYDKETSEQAEENCCRGEQPG